MYTPHPPCCKIPFCKRVCEKSCCCANIGKFGLKVFDEHRAKIMLTMTFVALVAFILSVIPVVSTSHNEDEIMDTYWTYGETDNVKFYVGLHRFVTKYNGDTQSNSWDSATCDNVELISSEDNFCNECKTACQNSVSVAITNLITAWPTVMTNVQRSTRRGDLNCQKVMAIVTGIISTITTLISLSVYADGCYRNLPSDIAGQDVEYHLGPGFICLLIATILKPFDVLVNILMPVVPEVEEDAIVKAKQTTDDPTSTYGPMNDI